MARTANIKNWEVMAAAPSRLVSELRSIPELSEVPEVVIQLLYNRGVTSAQEMIDFLAAEPPPTADPFVLRDLEKGVQRLLQAIDKQELIAVYGDFDVDGITSVVLMTEVLKAVGAKVIPRIPHRVKEGYGLHRKAVERLAARGVSVIVTVDCGIGAENEIEFAQSSGIDVIVTDHHQLTRTVPPAYAVINPRQPDCDSTFKDLAGVGVAFKLAQGLLRRRALVDVAEPAELEARLLDLVALGTIADVAPLIGENRTLVRRGLAALNQTERLGLREMANLAGVKMGSITPTTVSYILGPRLNAAGRLANAMGSFKLLTAKSPEQARNLAQKLEDINAERQRLTSEALVRAREEIAGLREHNKVFVLTQGAYPAGIVGLIAGKLAEEYYRPVLVLELGESESRGSARSIAELDITEALTTCHELLTRFGGHAQAAGFTIANKNLDEFRCRVEDFINSRLEGVDLEPRLVIDCELPLQQLDWATFWAVNRLSPFGFGNQNPVFLSRRVRVIDRRLVGRDVAKHLRLKLHDGRRQWAAIGFNLGEELTSIPQYIDIVYSVVPNEWNGTTSLDLQIKAWRAHESSA